ncbi:MAG: hypothetical protein NDP13_05870 [Crenarchaeota archaeon]|nr:hypothetical protein [Thermoproteota archaeon]MCR8454494.1 hypothetical protein [Thermoproteota archaeon]MCR8455109.1 hypothetical protein [Thermoproteota archaeon]MCR8462823.1 hypothetical protein [Thermoproteota archaeon]MCR8473618.1 hypothetical protein [Thermoproteota archaeon]
MFILELVFGIISEENTWKLLNNVLIKLALASKFELSVNKTTMVLAGSSVPIYILRIGSRVTHIEPRNMDALFVLSSVDEKIIQDLRLIVKKDVGRVSAPEVMYRDSSTDATDVEGGLSTISLIAFFLYELSKYLSLSKRFVEKVLRSIEDEEKSELIERFRLVSRSERI